MRISIHAQPGARRSHIAGEHGNALKVKIHAPPVDGKANAELIDFLVSRLGVRRAQMQWVSGELSREKTLLVVGLGVEEIRLRLLGG